MGHNTLSDADYGKLRAKFWETRKGWLVTQVNVLICLAKNHIKLRVRDVEFSREGANTILQRSTCERDHMLKRCRDREQGKCRIHCTCNCWVRITDCSIKIPDDGSECHRRLSYIWQQCDA